MDMIAAGLASRRRAVQTPVMATAVAAAAALSLGGGAALAGKHLGPAPFPAPFGASGAPKGAVVRGGQVAGRGVGAADAAAPTDPVALPAAGAVAVGLSGAYGVSPARLLLLDAVTGRTRADLPVGHGYLAAPIAFPGGRVAVDAGATILVVDGRTGRVVTRVPATTDRHIVRVDGARGRLVIVDADKAVVSSEPLPGGPSASSWRVALPSGGYVDFVAIDLRTGNVTVVSEMGGAMNPGAGGIATLDGATGRILAVDTTDRVGGGSVTADEARGRLYVDRYSNALVAIDLASGRVLYRASVTPRAGNGSAVATGVDPASGTLLLSYYGASSNAGSVALVDGATGRTRAIVATGGAPENIAVPAGLGVALVDLQNGRAAVIDLASGRILAPLDVGGGLTGAAYDPLARRLVVSTGRGTGDGDVDVYRVVAPGGGAPSFARLYGFPVGETPGAPALVVFGAARRAVIASRLTEAQQEARSGGNGAGDGANILVLNLAR